MGELHSASVTLAEILAYIKQTRQTGRLNVRTREIPTTASAPAALTFDQGHLVDARSGDEQGDDLVYRLLSSRDATYSFDRMSPDALPSERTISRVQELLVLAAIGVLSEEDTGAPSDRQSEAFEAAARPPAAVPAPPPATERRHPRPFKRRNMIPLPHGEPAYLEMELPADFVRLLDLLERDQLSGYVTWFSEGAEGLLLLYQGQVIDAFWAEVQSPATYAERHAVRRFAAALGAAGQPHVEVYTLSPDFIWSYSSLAYGAYQPSEQGLEHVHLSTLLERLAQAGHTGCIKVVAGTQAAYLFLCHGRVLGEFRALPESLEPASGRAAALTAQPGSLVDIYTSPTPSELLALNAAVWPIERVVQELRRTAQDVLGTKAGQVLNLLTNADSDPQALRSACERAKKATRVFIGPDKHEELSRRMDRLLAHLQ